ncbi:hypothetical protein D3C83_99520 [compost metagenome]
MPGIVREQCVQRIHADHTGAGIRGELHQRLQVGKVADAPIALGAQAIQIHHRSPEPAVPDRFRQITTRRRDNQRHRSRRYGGVSRRA